MSAGNSSFEALLAELLSHQNDARRNAETVYNQNLETQPDTTVQELLRCLETGQVIDPPHRSCPGCISWTFVISVLY